MKITYKSYCEGLEKTIANFLKAKTMTHAAREPDAKLQHQKSNLFTPLTSLLYELNRFCILNINRQLSACQIIRFFSRRAIKSVNFLSIVLVLKESLSIFVISLFIEVLFAFALLLIFLCRLGDKRNTNFAGTTAVIQFSLANDFP